jgi:hypothetical protein
MQNLDPFLKRHEKRKGSILEEAEMSERMDGDKRG